jgi:hypothetical protein
VTVAVGAVVIAGLLLALTLGLQAGLDAVALLLLALLVAVGAVGVAVARRARPDATAPERCLVCGAISRAGAPSCHRCGAGRAGPA